jgi:hypothetical protein
MFILLLIGFRHGRSVPYRELPNYLGWGGKTGSQLSGAKDFDRYSLLQRHSTIEKVVEAVGT